MACALQGKRIPEFWKLVNTNLGGRVPLPTVVNGTSGAKQIAAMWRKHFEGIYNDPTCYSSSDVLDTISHSNDRHIPAICTDEVLSALEKLKSRKGGWVGSPNA